MTWKPGQGYWWRRISGRTCYFERYFEWLKGYHHGIIIHYLKMLFAGVKAEDYRSVFLRRKIEVNNKPLTLCQLAQFSLRGDQFQNFLTFPWLVNSLLAIYLACDRHVDSKLELVIWQICHMNHSSYLTNMPYESLKLFHKYAHMNHKLFHKYTIWITSYLMLLFEWGP